MKPFRLFIGGVGAILIILGVFYTVNTLNFRNNKASRVYLREASSSTTNSHVIKQGTSSAALLFIGDMMFDRYIRLKQATYGDDYVFSCMGDLLAGRDLIIGNLEGPITKASSTSLGSVIGSKENYSFTFPTSTAKLLSRHGITVVNLGNNHTLNKGVQGFASTKAYLRDAGVEYFGGFDEASLVLQKTVKGIPFSFVNYNQFGGSSPEIVSRTIKEEKAKGRIVIVYTHWGDEYTDVTNSVRDKAKLFVASGASLIIGTHPHVIQRHEVIEGVPVYYSLGNFIFDQYFQDDVMEGLAVLVTFDESRASRTKEYRVALLKDGRTCLK